MIVKRNSLNKLWIAVSNILDTKPIGKAQVTAYNFQLQPIGKGETNGEGFVEITPNGVPFIIVAESDKQRRTSALWTVKNSPSADSTWEEKIFKRD